MGGEIDPIVVAFDLFMSAIILASILFAVLYFDNLGIAPSITIPLVNLVKSFDYIIAFAFIIYAITSIISAYFIPSHPIFFVFFFVNIILVVLFTPILSNMYAQVAQIPIMASAFAALPMTAYFIGMLPLFTIILSTLTAIVSYGKGGGQTGAFG